METVENLPLIGGSPALDLVNTAQRGIPLPGAANHDHLQRPDDLVVWSARVGLITAGEARSVLASLRPGAGRRRRGAADVSEDPRGVLRRAARHHRPARERRGRARRDWMCCGRAGFAPYSGLSLISPSRQSDGSPDPAVVRRLRVGSDPAHVVTDRIAVAAVETLRDVQPERLRQCPVDEGGCGWLFVDRSRNGSRRWCRMADCGTQVKSRRLTERRRQHPPKESHAPRRTP